MNDIKQMNVEDLSPNYHDYKKYGALYDRFRKELNVAATQWNDSLGADQQDLKLEFVNGDVTSMSSGNVRDAMANQIATGKPDNSLFLLDRILDADASLDKAVTSEDNVEVGGYKILSNRNFSHNALEQAHEELLNFRNEKTSNYDLKTNFDGVDIYEYYELAYDQNHYEEIHHNAPSEVTSLRSELKQLADEWNKTIAPRLEKYGFDAVIKIDEKGNIYNMSDLAVNQQVVTSLHKNGHKDEAYKLDDILDTDYELDQAEESIDDFLNLRGDTFVSEIRENILKAKANLQDAKTKSDDRNFYQRNDLIFSGNWTDYESPSIGSDQL